jgi:hypothetical protein
MNSYPVFLTKFLIIGSAEKATSNRWTYHSQKNLRLFAQKPEMPGQFRPEAGRSARARHLPALRNIVCIRSATLEKSVDSLWELGYREQPGSLGAGAARTRRLPTEEEHRCVT